MESLDGTSWDVVIAGTGIQQSLLALSLSRTNLKVLHLDPNDYYGGAEAALSLQEAEAWVKRVNDDANEHTPFSHASIEQPPDPHTITDEKAPSKLSFSRAYSLALAPQLVYSKSDLLPKLVSSKVYRQLEFLAVGSWFTYTRQSSTPASDAGDALKRIPSSREDVFADTSLDLNGRRRLMKFLRFIGDEEQQADRDWEDPSSSLHYFARFLQQKFGIPRLQQSPLHALTLSSGSPDQTRTQDALHNIKRHLLSIGVFGRGFGSVIPKWGGLSEIAQVGCRAAAVGGATYVLDKPIVAWQSSEQSNISIRLQGGESVTAKWLVGCHDDLAMGGAHGRDEPMAEEVWCHSVSIVDTSLPLLFPPTAEGAPPPAGAVIYRHNDESSIQQNVLESSPVYMHVHSSDTGECPAGQSVIYASIPVTAADRSETAFADAHLRLRKVLLDVLDTKDQPRETRVLWQLEYVKRHILPSTLSNVTSGSDNVLRLPPTSLKVQFDDRILAEVKRAWKTIMGDAADEKTFMVFEDREDYNDTEDNDD